MRSLLKFIFEYERKNNSEMSGVLSANWSSNSRRIQEEYLFLIKP